MRGTTVRLRRPLGAGWAWDPIRSRSSAGAPGQVDSGCYAALMPGDTRYPEQSPHAGWSSDLLHFREAPAAYVSYSLQQFVHDASAQQIRAWDESIPSLQREASELVNRTYEAASYSAILEYQLPMEARRPDVVLLLGGPVLVLELKGKALAQRVDIDQAAAYARDLRG